MIVGGALAPILLGGSNGSGTRVYARLLQMGGVYQGKAMNYAFEPEAIIPHTRHKVPDLIEVAKSVIYNINDLPAKIRDSHLSWINRFARDIQTAAPETCHQVGWKHPRNLFILPFSYHIFPEMKLVHIVRDGRDMALAPNKGDFRALKDFVGDYPDTPAGYAAFWSFLNVSVAEWCAAHLGPRYIVTRFEDLCTNPVEETRRIFDQLDLSQDSFSDVQIRQLVQMPATISRWKLLPPDQQISIQEAAQHGLQHFGYMTDAVSETRVQHF